MVRYKKDMRIHMFLTLVLLFVWLAPLAEAEVEVELDPASGSIEDTFTYTLVVRDEELLEDPELVPTPDFEAQFVGSSSNVQIVNGQTSAEVRYIFELKAKRAGTLRTPEVEIKTEQGKERVAPLTVAISRQSERKKGVERARNSDLFLERELSKTVVYEGEQLFSNLKLYSRRSVLKGSFQDLLYDGFWKEDFGEPTVRTAHHQGEPVNVHEVRHVLFPLQPGTIDISPAKLNLVVREQQRTPMPWSRFSLIDPDFFGMSRAVNVTVTSEENRLLVKKLPEVPEDMKRLPLAYPTPLVGESSVSLGLNTDPLEVGESKTVVITLESTANIRGINELTLHLPPSIKAYQDAPEEVILARSDAFALKKRFRVSLVPEAPGKWELGSITFLIFHPEQEKYEAVSTRPITLVANGDPTRNEGGDSQEELSGNSDENTRSGKEQTLYRYQEEGWLEYLRRTLSLSLALFFFSLVILLLGSALFFYWLWYAPKPSSHKKKRTLSNLRTENATLLREDLSRELSFLLSPDGEQVYRGYLLEQKLSEALPENSTLKRELLALLDRLQSITFEPQERAEKPITDRTDSSALTPYAEKARKLLMELRELLGEGAN